jgi:tetratricopeptide (TPR) repeat protein
MPANPPRYQNLSSPDDPFLPRATAHPRCKSLQARRGAPVTAHQDAAAIYREIGERHGEAKALNNLGAALGELGRFEETIAALHKAAAIFGETGDRHGEGRAKARLGLALGDTGRFEEAITASQEAAAIFRKTGDQDRENAALGNVDAIRAARQA